MTIRQKRSPNITPGRNGWKPDIIVCHITEGGYDGAVGWLTNPTSEASTHFVVSKGGDVTQLVNLSDTAWGNGTTAAPTDKRCYGKSRLSAVVNRKTSANYYTISIEHEGFYSENRGRLTDKQLAATVELIKHIRADVKRLYGTDIPIDREHIVGHCDITPQWKPNCPGQNFQFDEIIRRLQEDDEVVDKTKIIIDGKEYTVNRILKDGRNFIELQSFTPAGYVVTYDAAKKLPGITSPRANIG